MKKSTSILLVIIILFSVCIVATSCSSVSPEKQLVGSWVPCKPNNGGAPIIISENGKITYKGQSGSWKIDEGKDEFCIRTKDKTEKFRYLFEEDVLNLNDYTYSKVKSISFPSELVGRWNFTFIDETGFPNVGHLEIKKNSKVTKSTGNIDNNKEQTGYWWIDDKAKKFCFSTDDGITKNEYKYVDDTTVDGHLKLTIGDVQYERMGDMLLYYKKALVGKWISCKNNSVIIFNNDGSCYVGGYNGTWWIDEDTHSIWTATPEGTFSCDDWGYNGNNEILTLDNREYRRSATN